MLVLALETIDAVRVVARPDAIDGLDRGAAAIVARIARDEALVIGGDVGTLAARVIAGDPHAIVVDDAGFSGVWIAADDVTALLAPFVDWTLPAQRPALAQGLIAAVPAKLWLDADRVLLLCPSAYAHELMARIG